MSKLLSTKIIKVLFVACALSSTVSAQAQNPVTPQPGQVLAPAPLNFIDVNSGRFGKLDIDMVDGQFYSGAADHLHLTARNLDLGQGELKALDIVIDGAHLQDFIVDKLTISTEGALNFDSGLVFNQKLLQFTSPATAQVTAQISEESLNKFLKAPSTLERLSVTAGKTGSLIANLLGNNGGNFGLTVDSAEGKLQRNNKIHIAATGKVGVSQLTIPLKAEVESKLFLQDGWVQVGETKLMTSGQEISPQLSEMLVKKINNLSNLGHRSDDIHFAFTDIKVQAGKQLVVTGTAQINRLRFGR
ncbi:MAG: hypothetical protein KA392_06995 [Candidatus Obscuribacter sp.]|nr:hypothetical protein [Candidatus Obscuribacter sp.]MBP6591709.1 hypothetical protein [Candidatus Obscuribacter sp.]MBP7576318.1 hypothetical protein [Candidatus Obscuribacter sp.]